MGSRFCLLSRSSRALVMSWSKIDLVVWWPKSYVAQRWRSYLWLAIFLYSSCLLSFVILFFFAFNWNMLVARILLSCARDRKRNESLISRILYARKEID